MWPKEFIFYKEGEKFLTLNTLGMGPRIGDYISFPKIDGNYRVNYLLTEDVPTFDVRTKKLVYVHERHIFLNEESYSTLGETDTMKPGKSAFIITDDETVVADIDLTKDEWDEPTRPRNNVINKYRATPTFREIITGLPPIDDYA